MRVPKFRVRTFMIAVAVLGIALAGLQRMDQRMQRLRALARDHLQRGVVNRLKLEGSVAHRAANADTEKYRIRAEYHHTLNQKYEYAARHPWLPVSSDPPEPR
jgi:hypothetical protein